MELSKLARREASGVPQGLLAPLVKVFQGRKTAIQVGRIREELSHDFMAFEILAKRLADFGPTRAIDRGEKIVPSRGKRDAPAVHPRAFMNRVAPGGELLRQRRDRGIIRPGADEIN